MHFSSTHPGCVPRGISQLDSQEPGEPAGDHADRHLFARRFERDHPRFRVSFVASDLSGIAVIRPSAVSHQALLETRWLMRVIFERQILRRLIFCIKWRCSVTMCTKV